MCRLGKDGRRWTISLGHGSATSAESTGSSRVRVHAQCSDGGQSSSPIDPMEMNSLLHRAGLKVGLPGHDPGRPEKYPKVGPGPSRPAAGGLSRTASRISRRSAICKSYITTIEVFAFSLLTWQPSPVSGIRLVSFTSAAPCTSTPPRVFGDISCPRSFFSTLLLQLPGKRLAV